MIRRFLPYLLLAAVSFPLWLGGVFLRGGTTVLDHSPIDQHTRQARAWLSGRIDLPAAPPVLEIAEYEGRWYNSFPPTPSVFEVPLVLAFGKHTPSSLVIYTGWLVALCAQYALLRRLGWGTGGALLLPLAFVFGSNLYVFCVRANVWSQGQAIGYALASVAVCLVTARDGRSTGPGYLLLSLAVGCRPFYLFMAPLLVVLDVRTSGRTWRQAATTAACWMAPYGLVLAGYNFVRFDNPLEFGHNHLEWARRLPRGIFSPAYVPRNAYHAFLRLPDWSPGAPPLFRFDPYGTAFWLHSGIFLAGVWALVRRPLDREVRLAAAFALCVTWSGLLMHETNGWRQIGYRYLIDLLPTAFALVALGWQRFTPFMAAAFAWSLAVNLYGLVVWKDVVRE